MVLISTISLIAGAVVAVIGLVGVLVYLFATRSLHTSGAFPVHIYDIPVVLGIWASVGTCKLGCLMSEKRDADSGVNRFQPKGGLLILIAVLASVAVYVFTAVTSSMHG